ncbi:MAG TPA: hypothetical protein VGL77_16965 [Armatimonadota bacterium]|jgi:hypothetical protein
MSHFSLRCHLWGGILAIGLGGLALQGCNDVNTPTTGPTMAVSATVADPAEPTADEYALAGAKPATLADAVAIMEAPVLSASDGAVVTPAGTESLLMVDCGDTGVTSGNLPLLQNSGRVEGNGHAMLPKGNNAISLSPGTCFDMDDKPELHGYGTNQLLRLSDFRVQFSVHEGRPPSWTMPSQHVLHIVRHRKMFVLNGSFLELRWNGRKSVPPMDNLVTITADLYNGTTKVAGPLKKTVPVYNNTALFTSSTNVEFNRVAISIDLRDAK